MHHCEGVSHSKARLHVQVPASLISWCIAPFFPVQVTSYYRQHTLTFLFGGFRDIIDTKNENTNTKRKRSKKCSSWSRCYCSHYNYSSYNCIIIIIIIIIVMIVLQQQVNTSLPIFSIAVRRYPSLFNWRIGSYYPFIFCLHLIFLQNQIKTYESSLSSVAIPSSNTEP